jgi:hypothetical protein
MTFRHSYSVVRLSFPSNIHWLHHVCTTCYEEPTCFRLAQGLLRLLRCGQTLFSSFLIWLSAGDWLLPRWRTGSESYPSFRWKSVGHSLLLCFGVSLREVVFKLVARPVGKTAASVLRGATQTPGYVKELKLFWFGDFKIQFGSCILAYRATCLASLVWYIDDPNWGLENGERQAVRFQLCRFVFCLLICEESVVRFCYVTSSWCK